MQFARLEDETNQEQHSTANEQNYSILSLTVWPGFEVKTRADDGRPID